MNKTTRNFGNTSIFFKLLNRICLHRLPLRISMPHFEYSAQSAPAIIMPRFMQICQKGHRKCTLSSRRERV